MEKREQNDTTEAVRWPLNVFHAGLSAICPGLGQFWQAGFFFSQLHPTRFAVSSWYFILWVFAFEVNLLHIHHFKHDTQPDSLTLDLVVGLVLAILSYLFIAFLTLFSVLDAATWKPGMPMQFKKHMVILTTLFVSFGIILLLVMLATWPHWHSHWGSAGGLYGLVGNFAGTIDGGDSWTCVACS